MLYEFAIFLENFDGGELRFEFFDKDLSFYRKSNGRIVLKKKNEYEIYCVSDEETNLLAGKIYKCIEIARDFVKNIVIKKYVKNRSIYVEVTRKFSLPNNITNREFKTIFTCNIENVCVSFIQKSYEFMYLWLNELSLAVFKSENIYKIISIRLKDYQVDHYLDANYYPIVLSPLLDQSYEHDYHYTNVQVELTNLILSEGFYQIDKILVLSSSIDLRLEYKFLEKFNSFIIAAKKIFNQKAIDNNKKTLKEIVTDIDNCNFLEEADIMSYENFLLIKKVIISDIKVCFSLKFENIDMFLEKTAFLILKPLIEELGLRILNMDSAIFSFYPFIKSNIFQSTDEFSNIISTFYYNQMVSELVKSLGGISSITSMQIVEGLNNNILKNIRSDRNSEELKTNRQRYRNKIKELVIFLY